MAIAPISKPGVTAAGSPSTDAVDEVTPDVAPVKPEAQKKMGWLAKGARTVASQPVALANNRLDVGGLLANFNLRGQVTEKVALLPTDPLITDNEDRSAAAANGTTWTKIGVLGGGGASLIGLGVDRSVKVSAVVPTDSTVSAQGLVKLVKDQANMVTLSLHPDAIASMPPGTEFNLQSSKIKSASFRPGTAVSTFGLNAGFEAGFEARAKEASYEKNISVGQDGVIGFRIDRTDIKRSSVGAGFGVGFGVIDGTGADRVGDFSNEPNHANIVAGSIGAGTNTTKTLSVTGNPQVTTEEGKAGYLALMKLDPYALQTNPAGARAALEHAGLTVASLDTTTTSGFGAKASVLGTNLFTIGSSARSSDGEVLEVKSADGKVIDSTKLSEREYSKTMTGALPRWVKGEEREASARMGSISVNGGPTTQAALFSLSVTQPHVSARDSEQLARFSSELGYPTEQKTTGADGKGSFAVQLALTDEGIAKLDAMSTPAFRAALEGSIEKLDGRPLPWNDSSQSHAVLRAERYAAPQTVKERFADLQRDLATLDGSGDGVSQRSMLLQNYRATTGRDFNADLNAYNSVEWLTKAFDEGRGKPLDKRGPWLSTLSKLSAPELRAALVTLRSVADAGVVKLDYAANGVAFSAKPEVAAPKSSSEVSEAALTHAKE